VFITVLTRACHLYLVLSHIKVDYWLSSRGLEFRRGQESARPPDRPDRPLGTLSIIFNWHRVPFPVVKRSGREADQSPPSSVEVNNEWIYTSTLHVQYILMA